MRATPPAPASDSPDGGPKLLSYWRGLTRRSAGVVRAAPYSLWEVVLSAIGGQPVRVSALRYEVALAGSAPVANGDARPVIDYIASELDAVEEHDFLIVRLVPGAVISPWRDRTLIELPLVLAREIERLTVELRYAGPDGAADSLTVVTHPEHGLPPDPPTGLWPRAEDRP